MYEVESRESRQQNIQLQAAGKLSGTSRTIKPEKLVPVRSGVLAGSPRRDRFLR
ncbi:hypothetical protein K466DRAFT_589927 [Polyporus arcularius HHB13444]|uniref:Uncharacterized protein n=1 Tax=Polyporus arcularius HHB13444 TaxID=1314778 RepID=A0A5C3P0J0_9APHY|nr:hypothetical protein K466DRAFT_589927 [Polyporus arcularius HHB13444]